MQDIDGIKEFARENEEDQNEDDQKECQSITAIGVVYANTRRDDAAPTCAIIIAGIVITMRKRKNPS